MLLFSAMCEDWMCYQLSSPQVKLLTLWEPAYNIFICRFRPKNSSFRLPYQRPSSSNDCARELFKGSKRINQSNRLHSKKNFLPRGCGFFVTDVTSEVVLGSFWLMLPGQSVLLKFSWETRLESKRFEPLIDFPAFLVQKLWSKMDKLFNYLIS